jgi:hypothetical protein
VKHLPSLDVVRRDLGLSYLELWIDYFALGGALDVVQLTRYLRGDRDLTNSDHNVLVHALNEVFQDRGENHPLSYRAV